MPRVVVNTHGHCFDGACSAALFTSFIRKVHGGDLTFSYRSCGYGPKMSQVPVEWLSGDINAILDFRYTESERLTYYFDHHKTGFGSTDEQAKADEEAPRSGRKIHYDPTYGSCTKLIADVARRDYREDLGSDDLVRWAEVIDTAGFASAEDALGLAPAQRVAMVVEQHGDTPFLAQIVPLLVAEPLEDLVKRPLITERERPILDARRVFTERVKARAKVEGEVVFVNLTNDPPTTAGKFVTYALYPTSMYSVMLTRTGHHLKLSVGYNPWSGKPRRHDIAELVRREGGGGHPVVGAAAFATTDLERAREAAARVLRSLAE